MNIVITYGTYDLLHIGHISMLKRCRSLGDRLIVGLSTDAFNLKMKNKVCIQTYAERKEILEALRWVDQVIPEENWEQKSADVENYSVDVFAIGDDWKGKFDFLKSLCKVIYLPRTEGISTTLRKNQIVQTFSLPGLRNPGTAPDETP
ncbi:MAG: glycerol-3-phosphate cytidylyltransferase [Desulfovibrio sp.]|jgi:glycerol-3-phosphate cytidylyltransferase|nr:glycerol-3-phosphate cytidylyltransferase [Desulfovibrio sp.]